MTDTVTPKEKNLQNHILDPIEVRERARHMLGLGQMKAARELVQQALQQHPTHEGLLHMWDVIRPGEVRVIKRQYKNRGLERIWIRENRDRYQGKWVALIDDNPLAIEDDLGTLLEKVQEQNPEQIPLIHKLV
jgi:hypothetical protein